MRWSTSSRATGSLRCLNCRIASSASSAASWLRVFRSVALVHVDRDPPEQQRPGERQDKVHILYNSNVAPRAEAPRAADVAVVGSKLLFEDGTIQHAGVAFSREWFLPYHIYRGTNAHAACVSRRRELQCVTAACMLVRRTVFEQAEGFDEGYRNGFEDVDLCLKIKKLQWRIVYQPRSVLYHLESKTPGRKAHEQDNSRRLHERWGSCWWLADVFALVNYLQELAAVFHRFYDRHCLPHTRSAANCIDKQRPCVQLCLPACRLPRHLILAGYTAQRNRRQPANRYHRTGNFYQRRLLGNL